MLQHEPTSQHELHLEVDRSLKLRDYPRALDSYLKLFELQQQAPLSFERGYNQRPLLCSAARLRHDLEQIQYLSERNLIGTAHLQYAENLNVLLQEVLASPLAGQVFPLHPEAIDHLPYYNKAFHVYRPGPLKGSALNPNFDFEKINYDFSRGREIQVVDDFLTPEALKELQRFCNESVFWFDMHRDEFIGAHVNRGFVCGLLFQIAHELQERLPDIIRDEPLYAAWGFRCGTGPRGVGAHTDDGKVSINIWISSDSANLEPERGGLVLYDVEPPQVWTLKDWYGNEELLLDFIDRHPDKKVEISHKQNRAAIFASRFVHHSDTLQFREGYENRRTNVALLFGDAHL